MNEISAAEIVYLVICLLLVGAVFLIKSKKHSRDHLISRRRERRTPPPATNLKP